MKVFSKRKFIDKQVGKIYEFSKSWVDVCDGKPVKDGRCGNYLIDDEWCIDVPETLNCKCVMKHVDGKKEEKKVYTMKDFREKKIAVRVGKKHVKEFLQMCEAEGMRWASGDKATGFVPNDYGEELAITFNSMYDIGKLTYGKASSFKNFDIRVIDFCNIKRNTDHSCYKITIECDGTTTTARMEVNGKEVKSAQAKRNPDDKFSWRVGAETAFGRLWDNGEKKKKQERPFKVGDRVVCIKATDGKENTVGKKGHVIGNTVCGVVSVEFDEYIDGHDCIRLGKKGYCWNCREETLRHE